MQVQFKSPANLSQWMERFAPTAEQSQQHGRTVYTLPVIPALGPTPMVVATQNSNTVCFSGVFSGLAPDTDGPAILASLRKLVTHREQPNTSLWANAFRRVGGGLLTYAVTSEDIRTHEEIDFSSVVDRDKRIEAEAILRILHTFDTFALGVDLSEEGDRVGIRIRIGCRDRADTDTIFTAVQQGHRLALLDLSDPDSAGEPGRRKTGDEIGPELTKQFLERMVIDVEDHSDGSSEVYIRSALSHPSLIGLIINEISSP